MIVTGDFQSLAQNFRLVVFLLLVAFSLSGCTHGLEPLSNQGVQPGFGGTVRFISAWPPADSVVDVRIVAFYNYPPHNIFGEVTSGQAKVYPPIGPGSGFKLFVDSVSYSFTLDSASTFQYVVVALQYGSNVTADWKVVGAYGYAHGVGTPRSVVVGQNTFVNGINIDVDFQNVPPTPGGFVAALDRERMRLSDAAHGRGKIR
ncbi:MAG TPA: hypothetical protein VIS48_05240 [Candidatus Kryptonia bacterium]